MSVLEDNAAQNDERIERILFQLHDRIKLSPRERGILTIFGKLLLASEPCLCIAEGAKTILNGCPSHSERKVMP